MSAYYALVPPIIAIEGLDGSGKSTVWSLLKDDPDFSQLYFTCEMLSPVGAAIRADPGWREDVLFKLFAFPADRAWLLRTIQSLKWTPKAVVWERYLDSAIVYRGAEYDLHRSDVTAEWTAELNSVFPTPLKTLYFTVTVDEALRRRPDMDPRLLAAVQRQYDALRNAHSDRYITIDASQSLDRVVADTKGVLQNVIEQLLL